MSYWYRAHSRTASFFGILCSYAMLVLAPPTAPAQLFTTVHVSGERPTLDVGTLFIRSPFTQNFGPYELYSAAFQIRSERTILRLAVYTMHPIGRADRMIAGYMVGDPIIDLSYSVLLHRATNTSGFLNVGYFPLYAYGLPQQPINGKTLLGHCVPATAGLRVGMKRLERHHKLGRGAVGVGNNIFVVLERLAVDLGDDERNRQLQAKRRAVIDDDRPGRRGLGSELDADGIAG